MTALQPWRKSVFHGGVHDVRRGQGDEAKGTTAPIVLKTIGDDAPMERPPTIGVATSVRSYDPGRDQEKAGARIAYILLAMLGLAVACVLVIGSALALTCSAGKTCGEAQDLRRGPRPAARPKTCGEVQDLRRGQGGVRAAERDRRPHRLADRRVGRIGHRLPFRLEERGRVNPFLTPSRTGTRPRPGSAPTGSPRGRPATGARGARGRRGSPRRDEGGGWRRPRRPRRW